MARGSAPEPHVLQSAAEVLSALQPEDRTVVTTLLRAGGWLCNLDWLRFLLRLWQGGSRGKWYRAYLWLSKAPHRPQWRRRTLRLSVHISDEEGVLISDEEAASSELARR